MTVMASFLLTCCLLLVVLSVLEEKKAKINAKSVGANCNSILMLCIGAIIYRLIVLLCFLAMLLCTCTEAQC